MNSYAVGYAVVLLLLALQCDQIRCGQKEEMMEMMAACGKEFDISSEMKMDMKSPKIADMVPSENLKCFAKCMLNKADIAVGGKLDEAKLIALKVEHEGKVEAVIKAGIDKCKGLYTGADTCDEAWQLFKCFYEQEEAA